MHSLLKVIVPSLLQLGQADVLPLIAVVVTVTVAVGGGGPPTIIVYGGGAPITSGYCIIGWPIGYPIGYPIG